MLENFMAMNSGPLSLKTLRRALSGEGSTRISAEGDDVASRTDVLDPPRSNLESETQTRQKLEGIVHGRNLRHLRLTFYLLAVLFGGTVMAVACGALGHWRSAAYAGAAAFSFVSSSVASTLVLDRAVFRAMLPCAFLFLVVSVVVFPWNEVVAPSRLALRSRRVLSIAASAFLAALMLSVTLAGIQIRVNKTYAAMYEKLIDEVCLNLGTDSTIVAWDWEVMFYRSPLTRSDERCVAIYPVNIMNSHPKLLQRLQNRFGEDVYAGMARSDVIHLASPREVDILTAFYGEHYSTSVEVTRLETFEYGTAAWVLVGGWPELIETGPSSEDMLKDTDDKDPAAN
jgi:hypothetical protein